MAKIYDVQGRDRKGKIVTMVNMKAKSHSDAKGKFERKQPNVKVFLVRWSAETFPIRHKYQLHDEIKRY